ncbi:MBL fold metallo-hydrolase [Sulfuritalea hydrogenivorans]|uniref:Beta-lactamase-like protein n=1 Tax=Sulfuritalea hydrogenivorans sk43H TaxID=1223802 RepID=W0SJE1_9PROT|nr:MBL fold metallo-hydrolase [Sulfuritalea hydrogenivorans]BAO30203.1 beta-lactamase-like protein [Sulfuritalea hydrogenivorans sk43H]
MRFASLGSGSRGNALLVEAGSTRLLIDAGFGTREMVRRLERLGLAAADIDAVLVTHEHSDHIGGVFACARRFDWAVLLTHGTLAACRDDGTDTRITIIDSHEPFSVGDICVRPFPVPHDAREPVQFVLGDGARTLGVVTDAGHVTRHMVDMLDACDALVLECNHDVKMLAQGSYPQALKRRIGGLWGHLDNAAAALLLSRIRHSGLRHVVAAHLSEENNSPALAQAALSAVLDCAQDWVGIATQDDGFAWRDL